MAGDNSNSGSSTSPEYMAINDLPSGTSVGGRSDWGNKVVVNTGTVPVINFAFMLRVEGVFDLPCKAIKGIRRENEFDYIQEGGLNDYVHLKRKAITKPFTFQVERYVGVDWVDPLPLGVELVLPVILFVNKGCFPSLKPVRTYTFTGCTVISKDYGEMNAEASGLLIETVTIAYREMVCINIPSATYESDDVWKFDNKTREGKGTRRYNKNLYNDDWEKKYNSKSIMEERAESKRWKPERDADGKLKNKYGKTYLGYIDDYNKQFEKELEDAKGDEAKLKEIYSKMKVAGASEARLYKIDKDKPKNYSSAKHHATETNMETMAKTAASKAWKAEKGEDGKLKSKYGNTYLKYVDDYNKQFEKELEDAKGDEGKTAEIKEKMKSASAADARLYKLDSGNPRNYSSAKYNESEAGMAEMQKKAKKYKLDKGNPKNYSSAKHNETEKSMEEMQKGAKQYKLDKNNSKNYSSAKYHENEKTKDNMNASARRYAIDGDNPKNYRSAKHDPKEANKTKMLSNVRAWPKKSSARNITDFLKKR